jgi:glutathione S-transferase
MHPSEPITVYGYTPSSNVQVVMWGIGELELPYRFLEFGHSFGGLDTPELPAHNPHGLVPVIRDGHAVIWESCAILRNLAARYGSGPFWPQDPAVRARVDMWAEWGKVKLRTDFTGPIFWARVRTPAARRDEAALTAALARFDADLAILEAQIGATPWVLGDDFTVADILVGHQLYRYFTIDIPRPDRPGIADYYARLVQRPAFARHVMVSYAPLAVDGA